MSYSFFFKNSEIFTIDFQSCVEMGLENDVPPHIWGMFRQIAAGILASKSQGPPSGTQTPESGFVYQRAWGVNDSTLKALPPQQREWLRKCVKVSHVSPKKKTVPFIVATRFSQQRHVLKFSALKKLRKKFKNSHFTKKT